MEDNHEIVGYFFNPNIHPYQEFINRLQCLERYTALRPVEVIYDKEYNLDKYLVGSLQAKYIPTNDQSSKTQPTKKELEGSQNGAFVEEIHPKESLTIKLTPKEGESDSLVSAEIDLDESSRSNGQGQPGNKPDQDYNPRCGYCIMLRLARTAEYASKNGFDGFTTTLLESKYQPHNYIKEIGTELAEQFDLEFYYEDFRQGWKESIKISKELNLYRQQYCGCIFSEYERYGPSQ